MRSTLSRARFNISSTKAAHPDALHFLGVLTHNQGDSSAGICLIERSLQIAPRNAHAWLNLGNVWLELDCADKAHAAGLGGVGYNAEAATRSWNQMKIFFGEIFGK